MKRLLIFTVLIGLCTFPYAKSLDDWSNEDLCRWIDAVQLPNPILFEIEVRNLACLTTTEIIKASIQESSTSDHGKVFLLPSTKNSSNNHPRIGLKVIFNYKITL